jgi:hypothetical protein
MPKRDLSRYSALNLRVGEWVEVRNREEILATLDEQGRLENLPFMPEMLEYCGQRLRVFKRSDKTCDYIQGWSIRRMADTVHLEGVRCDGVGHDGCQAGCLIFWKEAWLKRADSSVVSVESLQRGTSPLAAMSGLCTVESILAASQAKSPEGETVYSCQGTDVPKFTSYMSGWDLRQYIRDLRSGNLATGLAGDSTASRVLELALGIIQVIRSLVITTFNKVQAKRHGIPYPFIEGTSARTPTEFLNLQPGELVQVRSKEEIMATLDKTQKNRGLWFDSEMLPYCGGIYRVLRPVHHIIEEKTGKMIDMKFPCIVLEGVVCRSDFHRLCPRAIFPYWRENWLKRAVNAPALDHLEQGAPNLAIVPNVSPLATRHEAVRL